MKVFFKCKIALLSLATACSPSAPDSEIGSSPIEITETPERQTPEDEELSEVVDSMLGSIVPFDKERSYKYYIGNEPSVVANSVAAGRLKSFLPQPIPDEFSTASEVELWEEEYAKSDLPIIPIFIEGCRTREYDDDDGLEGGYGVVFDPESSSVRATVPVDVRDQNVCKPNKYEAVLSKFFEREPSNACDSTLVMSFDVDDTLAISAIDSDAEGSVVLIHTGVLKEDIKSGIISWTNEWGSFELDYQALSLLAPMDRSEARENFDDLSCLVFYKPASLIFKRTGMASSFSSYDGRYMRGYLYEELYGNLVGFALFNEQSGDVIAEVWSEDAAVN